MKSATKSVRKAPKCRNFHVLYAFSVCHGFNSEKHIKNQISYSIE
jgi:hypothetical protein